MSGDLKEIVKEKYGQAALRVVTGEGNGCCGGCGAALPPSVIVMNIPSGRRHICGSRWLTHGSGPDKDHGYQEPPVLAPFATRLASRCGSSMVGSDGCLWAVRHWPLDQSGRALMYGAGTGFSERA